MQELIKVNLDNSDKPTVSARELHSFLEIGTEFANWFKRMTEYGFIEGTDFSPILAESTGGRPSTDYQVTTKMAEHICMIQRNDKGMQARNYFIAVYEAWNTPEMVMARAIKIMEKKINQLSGQVEEMKPKAEYFDALVDRNLLSNFRDTAKALKIQQSKFTAELIQRGYVYYDQHNQLKPYAQKNNGYFELKEFIKGDWTGLQTLITPKGRETFRLLLGD